MRELVHFHNSSGHRQEHQLLLGVDPISLSTNQTQASQPLNEDFHELPVDNREERLKSDRVLEVPQLAE
jgi:hypothetical protein